MIKRTLLLMSLLLLLSSCASFITKNKYQTIEDGIIKIYYKEKNYEDAQFIYEGVKQKYRQTIEMINPNYTGLLKVRIYESASSLRSTKEYGSERSQVYVDINDRNEIMIIAPSSGDMPAGFDDLRIVVIHEFAHIVTRSLNPQLKEYASWLWEAIAYFNAGQKRGKSNLNRYWNVGYLDNPSRWNDPWVSPLSYYIGDFLYQTWGVDGINALVKNNGNIEKAFGISREEYYEKWTEYVRPQL